MAMGRESLRAIGPGGRVGARGSVEPIEVLQHLHTYGNHPVVLRGGAENIEILKRENLIQAGQDHGSLFLEGLKTLAAPPNGG